MKPVLLSVVVVLGASVPAIADVSVAPNMGPTVLFHDDEADENGCHVAKRKRHNYHCHAELAPVVQEDLDVTEDVPATDREVASASD